MIPFFALAACSQPKATLPALDLSDLDTTVSPKVDFYRYATGGWQAKNPLRPEFARYGSFDAIAENTQKQKILITTGYHLTDCSHCVRIILFAGQNNGFNRKLRIIMGIKIPDDQVRFNTQSVQMFQSAVTADDKIIRTQILPNTHIIPNVCSADDHATLHFLTSPSFIHINYIPGKGTF